MDPDTLILLEALLVVGIVLGLGVWQLVSLHREQKRRAEKEKGGR